MLSLGKSYKIILCISTLPATDISLFIETIDDTILAGLAFIISIVSRESAPSCCRHCHDFSGPDLFQDLFRLVAKYSTVALINGAG